VESVHLSRPGGLPRWLMWALVPVMLAGGFVSGMALAVYRPGALARPPASHADPTNTASVPATPQPTVPLPDSSWRIVTSGTPATTTTEPWDAQEMPWTQPPISRVQFTGPATTIMEARLALQSDFSEYRVGNTTLYVEYQQMRQSAMGVSLVGLLHAHDYEDWATALRTDPDALKRWLEAAARRVQDASTRDRFHLSWAVVEVLRDPPEGFGPAEVTLLDNRAYLVTRPLASTVDHTKAEVSLRPLASLEQAAGGQPVISNDPWAAYGPVLRFDAADIYRPERVRGAKPFTP
jgi:hypothetical protein